MVRRINAIALLYAGVLSLHALFIQSIGSGIGVFSGLFQVNILSNLFAFFILLVGSIIIFLWLNFYKMGIKNITYNYIENNLKSNNFNLIILFNIIVFFY